jgi:hypothetical protein
VYWVVPADWHLVDEFPKLKTGVPTNGVTVTVCCAVTGPLQPAAEAVMTVVPDHETAQFMVPDDAFMLFPPESDAASRLYVIPDVFVAFAW